MDKRQNKREKRIVQGYTYYCPILVFVLLIGLFDIIFAEDILAFIIIFTVCAVLFVSKTKEENELIECVKRLLTQ